MELEALESELKEVTIPSNNGIAEHAHFKTISLTDEEPSNQLSTSKGICFHDICYEIAQRKCCMKLPNKKILQNISGIMGPGLNAIMGPTGSGKTSLLDILAARKTTRSGITGKVLLDGQRQPDNFKCMSGYVVQDDVVMGTLTVRENLYFSAALRLSNKISWAEKKLRVQKVLEELGLTDCADTKVGTAFFRGVSGGERKRTNIGMELIIEPQVLFVDEPTTGLDAFTAVSVVQLLKNLSKVGERVVIMSIHQPRYSIYKLFDTLTLLSRGELVYHGPNNMALEHFIRLGYICEEHDNPADVMLDVINECEIQTKNDTSDQENGCDLSKFYTHSSLGEATRTKSHELVENLKQREKEEGSKIRTSHKYPTNFFWQLLVVIMRSILNIVRNPQLSIIQTCIVVTLAIIVGALYFQLDTGPNGYQNRIGAIFFIVLNQIFGNINAVEIFITQKKLFIHENASGFYRVSVYFISKVVCDIIPLRLIPLSLFCIIAYFMIGFQLQVDKFFIFFVTLFLTSLSASSVAFCISGLVRVSAIGSSLIAIAFVIQMLFGGFLIALESLPIWLQWLQYISVFRYAVEALAVNEVEGLTFNITVNSTTHQEVTGETLLATQGFDPDWLFYDWIGLLAFSVLFITLAYIILRLIKKDK